MDKKRLRKSRYITGFDGLRTLAVVGVILYHLMPYRFTGGYLGVPIFFVVSGYLITDLLLQEWNQNKKVSLTGFYKRRIKRLYPALIAMLISTTAYITLFQRNLLNQIRGIIGSNLLYVYNWWQINHGQSYFDRFADNESPFTHLWSLSIEGQYYLLWPIIVVFMLVFIKNKKRIFYFLMVLVIISAAAMAILYNPAHDPSRLYYGTDTRLFSILLGSGLAFVWPSTNLKQRIAFTQRFTLDIIGLIAMIGVIFLFLTLDSQSAVLYRGGMLIFSVLSMIIVGITAHPGADWNRIFTNPVFTWIGKRSYGIYLYQFPVMIFFETKLTNVADHQILYPIIEVAIILAFAEISYRFIERPFQQFNYGHTWSYLKRIFDWKSNMRKERIIGSFLSLILLIGLSGLIFAPKGKANGADSSALATRIKSNTAQNAAKQSSLIEATRKANESSKKLAKDESASIKESKAKASSLEKEAAKNPVNQDLMKYGLTQVQLHQAQNLNILGIGDSVMADATKSMQKIFPKMIIDAKVSRQASTSLSIIQNYATKGAIPEVVVIGLGTNGPFTEEQMAAMMKAIGTTHQVFWINVRVPTRTWQNEVNRLLTNSAKAYSNLTIIDWYDYSNSHEDWFYTDRVHPNPTGMPYYSTFITKQILAKIY